MRPNGTEVITASRNQLLRHWHISQTSPAECKRSWKAHETPVISMAFDPSGTLLATGSSDRTIKVWDVDKGFATHNLKGHGGIVNAVKFFKDDGRLWLISSSEDTFIKVWDLNTSNCIATLSGHLSTPTCFTISEDGNTLVSSGRDKVLNVWNLRDFTLLRSHPVYEMVESMVDCSSLISGSKLNSSSLIVATVGEKGLARIWRVECANYTELVASTVIPSTVSSSKKKRYVYFKKILYIYIYIYIYV